MKKKQPDQKKTSVKKPSARKKTTAKTSDSLTVKSAMMSSEDSWVTVDIETTTITIQRGSNYRLPLDFSQAANGAGEFDSAAYMTTLTAPDYPDAVIQEDSNYKTAQRCAWIIYVPDDGYQSTINVSLTGQLRGTGWTGGSSVDGLWGTPELVY